MAAAFKDIQKDVNDVIEKNFEFKDGSGKWTYETKAKGGDKTAYIQPAWKDNKPQFDLCFDDKEWGRNLKLNVAGAKGEIKFKPEVTIKSGISKFVAVANTSWSTWQFSNWDFKGTCTPFEKAAMFQTQWRPSKGKDEKSANTIETSATYKHQIDDVNIEVGGTTRINAPSKVAVPEFNLIGYAAGLKASAKDWSVNAKYDSNSNISTGALYKIPDLVGMKTVIAARANFANNAFKKLELASDMQICPAANFKAKIDYPEGNGTLAWISKFDSGLKATFSWNFNKKSTEFAPTFGVLLAQE